MTLLEGLRFVHITCVILSGLGFTSRGLMMLLQSPLLHTRVVKIAPHIIDTLLLISGISLAVIYGFSPMNQPWLMAKLIGLVVYIVLGTIALKRGKTKTARATAFVGALLTFLFIIHAAMTKTVFG